LYEQPAPARSAPAPDVTPALTLADRLLATLLHDRFGLPQIAVATLFGVRPETINRRIRDTQQLLDQAGHPITPADQSLTGLDDLYDLATTPASPSPPGSQQRVDDLQALSLTAPMTASPLKPS
jgi:hypothetical protein